MTTAAHQTRDVIQQSILARLELVPNGLSVNELNALVRGISDLVGFAIVITPGSGYEPTSPGARPSRMVPGIQGIPLPQTAQHADTADTWPYTGFLGWYELDPTETSDEAEPGPRGYPGGVTYRGDNVLVFFESARPCVESAGWLTRMRRVSYGSPLEMVFQLAALPAVTAGMAAVLTYILTGRAAKRKTSAETTQIAAAATLAEAQLPFAARKANADVELIEAQRLVLMADAELKFSQAKKSNSDVEKQDLENLRIKLEIIEDLKKFVTDGSPVQWQPEYLWELLKSPGLTEAIDNLPLFQPYIEIIDDDAASSGSLHDR